MGAAESTHGHWSAEIRAHHVQDFHRHSMTLSGLSHYTEEGDSSVRSQCRMMWSENYSVSRVINEVMAGGGKDSHVEERRSLALKGDNSPIRRLSDIESSYSLFKMRQNLSDRSERVLRASCVTPVSTAWMHDFAIYYGCVPSGAHGNV